MRNSAALDCRTRTNSRAGRRGVAGKAGMLSHFNKMGSEGHVTHQDFAADADSRS
jgi:hypothetical protein